MIMDALNSMGNQLDNSDNLDDMRIEQIHQNFLYGTFGKIEPIILWYFMTCLIHLNQLYILIQGCKIYYTKIKRSKVWN